MSDFYNKAALERLSSPEQLDKTITISKPASWLVIFGVTVMIAAFIFWAVFGTLTTVMPFQGIISSQTVECYVPYLLALKIEVGMKATVQGILDDLRYDAKVTAVTFDSTLFSDLELVMSNNSIPVNVSLQIIGGELPERTLITANIITEEITPFKLLFQKLFP